MTTYTFERVTRPVTKTVPCRGCGKKLKRSTTLEQTINPFNKNDDGTVKTYDQIVVELREEATTWHPRNDICPTCQAVHDETVADVNYAISERERLQAEAAS